MKNSLIQWPRAKYWTTQWNPYIGCTPCSPACENCYAAAWAERFGQSFQPHVSSRTSPPKKGVVFCGNMTDLFGEWVNLEERIGFIAKAQERAAPKATYIWLTKRPYRMFRAIAAGWVCEKDYHAGEDILPETLGNHVFGFTAENQEWFDIRWKELVDGCESMNGIPTWTKLWVSVEPLLGALDMVSGGAIHRLSWVVVGCESGSNRRPCKLEWIESIVRQCRENNVPVFVKQICLPNGNFTNKIDEFPENLRIRQVPWTTKEEASLGEDDDADAN